MDAADEADSGRADEADTGRADEADSGRADDHDGGATGAMEGGSGPGASDSGTMAEAGGAVDAGRDSAQMCGAQGQCAQCSNASECPAETNPCKMATCSNRTCGTANKPSGSCMLSGGASGVCNAGSCVECATGSDCPSGRPYCVLNQCRPCNGKCSVGADCMRPEDCNSGICSAGTCRPSCSGSCAIGASCSVDSDCGDNNQCVNNGCVDCASDGNCPASAPYCSSNVCRQCRNNNSALCALGQECVGESCVTLSWGCDSNQGSTTCSNVVNNSSCVNNLCVYAVTGSYPFTCPTPPSGWTSLGYYNVSDIFSYNAGIPPCLLTCPLSRCPRGYTCEFKEHANPNDNTTSTVRVCWPDTWR